MEFKTDSLSEAIKRMAQMVNYSVLDERFNHPQNCCDNCSSIFPTRISGKWEKRTKFYKMMEKRIESYQNYSHIQIHSYTVKNESCYYKEKEVKNISHVVLIVAFANSTGYITHVTKWTFCRSGDEFFVCGPKDWQEIIDSHTFADSYDDPGAGCETENPISSLISKEDLEKEIRNRLLTALEKKDLEEIKKLSSLAWENGMNLKKDFLGPLLLKKAGYKLDDNVELFKYGIELGVDVNTHKDRGDSLLIGASYFGILELVSLLLEKGADVNYATEYGKTALLAASECMFGNRDYLAIARVLLNRGANVNALNSYGESPLIKASWNVHTELMELLIESGADVNIQDSQWGYTALMRAVDFHDQGKATKAGKLLLDKGANPNVRSKEGQTALRIAEEKEYDELVQLISMKIKEFDRR